MIDHLCPGPRYKMGRAGGDGGGQEVGVTLKVGKVLEEEL